MKQCLLVLIVFVVLTASALAQTAVPGQKFAWDQAAPDLASAQGYTYKHYDDGVAAAVVFTGVTCTGAASPFACEVLIPAYTPGSHSLTVTASNIAGESVKSIPFAFAFVVTPGAPVNIHIK